MSGDVLELGEIQEPDRDYRKLWEEEQVRVDSISKTYKQEEASKNKLLHALAKVKGALEANGIAEFDDEFNIKLIQRQETVKQETSSIDEQIKALKQQNRDGEIDVDDYTEQLADLVSEKKMKEYEKKVLDIKAQEQTKATVEVQQAEQGKIWDTLEGTYPDHNVPNSRLQLEMSKIMTNNIFYTGIDLTKPENIRFRFKLAEEAHGELVKQGLAKSKSTSNASMKNFTTMQSEGGTPPGEQGMSEQQKHVMGNFLNDPKLAKQINKMAQTLNGNGALLLEG